MWSVWHYAVIAILVLPLVLWAYFASRQRPQGAATVDELSPDTPIGGFLFRTAALVIGFIALFSLTSGGQMAIAVGQTLIALVVVAVLFGLAWTIPRLFGRKIQRPRKKAFELLLFVFALFTMLILLQLQVEQVAR
jgi:Na+/H+ antiporter NhaD/arsenite permease-like protein